MAHAQKPDFVFRPNGRVRLNRRGGGGEARDKGGGGRGREGGGGEIEGEIGEWCASTLHTTSEHGVSSITTADAHSSAASSLRPRRFI